MKILKIQNISKHFEGVHALSKLSFEIEKGVITSVVGPNGAGKTTLMNVLTGMETFDNGTFVVGDIPLTKVKPREMPMYRIARTFQSVRLFEQMTVLDNVLVVLTERNILSAIFEKHSKYHEERAFGILKRIGLWEKRNELAENLSYGQRKLLEIGRALAMEPEVYLFDEPFSGLFPEMVKKVKSIMKELREEGKTIVLISHNMEIIRELSDHVIVIESGTFLAEGKPDDVLSRKDVLEAYLGE
ncbi:MAG: ABC transporter ATP-binding protein [Candidatus Jacksonbacteria bacterium]|jgi:ABC-type branched-subunit amino acid transport system ATPase component|nr:ABC transporter ATP-binding protein [Candidatus Jacksonbacteria bacterium]MBT6757519.1 ABC transporter ATP-binding protein [Candidatus Jacksonbacteria bacterium]MBT6955242.1 ABC transporter ATP-binding protein [Candidatus Jacksonbacteria bacterium]MBT7008213.1 ABC transporter ATP-binding protein [Candidatus Jacksonbacteria bacterium]MBT7339442.1 ABC transporter ATP-binding protein [Candidatus Jacksonbacteria bacterium]